ncbi:hypothetical protein M3J09_004178 [Ascochyta lentis]
MRPRTDAEFRAHAQLYVADSQKQKDAGILPSTFVVSEVVAITR